MLSSIVFHCLDTLEAIEARALTWGLVDVSSSRDDLIDAWQEAISAELERNADDYFDESDVLQSLLARSLIVEVPGTRETRYRTRMAETVRLIARLRQLLPQHRGEQAWMAAPSLVSDYRFMRRTRRYPRRDIQAADMSAEIRAHVRARPVLKWLDVLLDARGPRFFGARFQQAAFERLIDAGTRTSDGTVIAAGTGSGKTLAFYLPALARVADLIARHPREDFAKVLAIYPRNELLKDQFSEIYAEARALDAVLEGRNLRDISIGAYFGPTPFDSKSIDADWECPYFRCPNSSCGGAMVWHEQDRRAGREVLTCAVCEASTRDGAIRLTRTSIQAHPPDILFTTTEMLNRRMGDGWSRHVLGINAVHPPIMCLLDEIHTYSGTHGAMVGHLLRRWHSLIRGPIAFVGLSATLKEACRFLADLTGVPEYRVEEIRPQMADLESEGTEYMLVVKGDPVSRTALLSTTIQTIMVTGRCLDSRTSQLRRASDGAFGTKTFVFTDDIDVTNRLYFATLDAEGRASDGSVHLARYPHGGLSHLRERLDAIDRYHAGQDWRACHAIGHNLNDRLRVGRTSSQDSGVDLDADVIVATSALEVGFNDSEVGAVIQHKAPREVAQFLQRKGRAGRSRKMRPWTMVVLSDYGRDRLAFQAYDTLFDPEVSIRVLPVSNRYVLRMQACYALIDYLGSRTNRLNCAPVNAWSTLAAPSRERAKHEARRLLAQEVDTLMRDPGERMNFRRYLKKVLGCSDEVVDQVLWFHPRPVFLGALPMARRRLETNWGVLGEPQRETWRHDSPLPEYVPQSLFGDLELPEVTIEPERNRPRLQDTPPAMPVHRAIKEFAPGRVSRRFGIRHALARHWVGPGLIRDDLVQAVQVDDFCDYEEIGPIRFWDEQWCSVRVLRPHVYYIAEPPQEVRDTSNAQLAWIAQYSGPADAVDLDVPRVGPWPDVFRQMSAFMHANHNQVTVRRAAMRSAAEIKRQGADPLRVEFGFARGQEQVGLGFEMQVDAVRIRLAPPKHMSPLDEVRTSPKWQSLRVTVFQRAAWDGRLLGMVPSPFARQWLAQVCLTAVTCEAVVSGNCLETAASSVLRSRDAKFSFEEVLDVIFQSSHDFEAEDEANGIDNGGGRLRGELLDQLADGAVLDDLYELCRYLWIDLDETWKPWLDASYRATMCAALKDAIQALCPDLETGDLIVDIAAGAIIDGRSCDAAPDPDEIWLSEPSPGGTGVIEEFVKRYAADPMRFMRLLESAVQPSEIEFVAEQFSALIEVLGTRADEALCRDVSRLRDAESPLESETALRHIRGHLERLGFATFHGFMSAITNRLFRPGATPDLDGILAEVVARWSALENHLGVELDARVVAYLLAREIPIEDSINGGHAFPGHEARLQWRFSILYGLLWPRGLLVRQKRLEIYSPFCTFAPVDPLLVREVLQAGKGECLALVRDAEVPGQELLQELSVQGEVTFTADQGDRDLIKQAMAYLLTNPVDTGDVLVFPRLRSIRRVSSRIVVEVEIAEAVQ